MLFGANALQFGGLKDDLLNSYLIVGDKYTKRREDVVGLLNNYRGPEKQHQHDKWGVQEELAFVQNGDEENKLNAMEGTKCHVCNKEGHWVEKCPTLLPVEQAQRKKYRE